MCAARQDAGQNRTLFPQQRAREGADARCTLTEYENARSGRRAVTDPLPLLTVPYGRTVLTYLMLEHNAHGLDGERHRVYLPREVD